MSEEQMPPKRNVEALIFIYDANSGTIGAFLDSTKKLLMVGGCPLCQITHGLLGEKAEWKECQQEIGVPVHYYHKNEIPPSLQEMVAGRLPCILAQVGKHPIMLLEPEVLKRCRGKVEDLKGRLNYYAAANNLQL
ncbi:hypothetical protein GF339_21290 [candidate division KSB3 bacterium]|uniref:Uncharacterized protein n=1 Tax=candidate division KSB3 bacterium TaxID=2044937 RepID=A0A9D5Q8S1_9BACT|nr:hypothetical protein [candidate division KSB3 bacterium]MBD3327136.1 hypothetical protein [candidate division KSB3 bacterium]